MEKITVHSEFNVYKNQSELPEDESRLMESAIEAAGKAYAPYSGLNVGAAVLLANGKIIQGNNQENASFPNSLCAERVALFAAGANFPNEPIKKVAITTVLGNIGVSKTLSPCGACRQAIAEVEKRFNQPVKILFGSKESEIYSADSIQQLLPFLFYEEKLKRH